MIDRSIASAIDLEKGNTLALKRDRRKMAISSTCVSRFSNIVLPFILDESKGQTLPQRAV